MNEDKEFEAFIKARLEEGATISTCRHEAIARAAQTESFALAAHHRSMRRLFHVALAAASLAAICLMTVVNLPTASSSEQTLANVIDLLRASDGIEADESSDSMADLLLAWQDEPYLSAISGLVADSSGSD